ncbi:hypothetical protein ABKN59_011234 [Abortiporus biennis]
MKSRIHNNSFSDELLEFVERWKFAGAVHEDGSPPNWMILIHPTRPIPTSQRIVAFGRFVRISTLLLEQTSLSALAQAVDIPHRPVSYGRIFVPKNQSHSS